MKLSGETEGLFTVLRQSAKPEPVNAIKKLIEDAPDRELCRINALAFAAKYKLDEEDVIAAFSARRATRHFRYVLEHPLSRLRWRPRFRRNAQDRKTGRIQVRPLRRGLRTDAR